MRLGLKKLPKNGQIVYVPSFKADEKYTAHRWAWDTNEDLPILLERGVVFATKEAAIYATDFCTRYARNNRRNAIDPDDLVSQMGIAFIPCFNKRYGSDIFGIQDSAKYSGVSDEAEGLAREGLLFPSFKDARIARNDMLAELRKRIIRHDTKPYLEADHLILKEGTRVFTRSGKSFKYDSTNPEHRYLLDTEQLYPTAKRARKAAKYLASHLIRF